VAIYQTCPIELLKAGDAVLTCDENDADGELVLQRIEETFARTAYCLTVVTLRSSTGQTQTLHTTAEHPVYALGKGWIACGQIEPGDLLQEPLGGLTEILSVRHESHPDGVTVYNFRVAACHTYFVREAGSHAEPAWVHNTCTFDERALRWRDNDTGQFVSGDRIGRVTPKSGAKFGTTDFGNEHELIADWFEQQNPGVDFEFRIRPGQTGIDITVPKAQWRQVGFRYADIKPRTISGFNSFNEQVGNWGYRASIRAISYDANGNFYHGF
jgi:hypothetical protein